MKKKVVSKILAGLLAAGMVISIAACGDTDDGGSSNPGSSTPTGGSSNPQSSTPTGGNEVEAFTKISVGLPLTSSNIDEHHDGESEQYDNFVKKLNEYTGMEITWNFLKEADYYNALMGFVIAGAVDDVQVVDPAASYFIQAAQEGLFWDLAPYLDEFDNLAMIPEAVRANISTNGKIYAIPRSRTLGRNGAGYRKDWLEALNLPEPETVEDWYNMLYAFTYNDPDGSGTNDDNVGMLIENYGGYFDMMEVWYGVPNGWGIDASGNLVPKQMTEEWKVALKEFKKWYEEGLIPPNFDEIAAGKYRNHLREPFEGIEYGAGVDVLDNLRKIEKDFEGKNENFQVGVDDFTFQLVGGMKGPDGQLHVLPTAGFAGGIAISTKNVKTEDQLRRVLQFLNDLNDGEPRLWIDNGFEGEIWYIGDDGYMVDYTKEEKEALGINAGTTYREGFNQVVAYYWTPENEKPYSYAPAAAGSVEELENQLYESNLDYVVVNYGAGYSSSTYDAIGADLDTMIGQARTDFIKGVINDEVGLDAAIEAWLAAGMQDVINEKNESYHAAGH